MQNIVNECKKNRERLIELRRTLHKIPEIAETLPQTRAAVCAFLDEIGVSYTLNPDDDGLIAEIKGGKEGKTLAFRADMDALNVTEDNDFDYKSVFEGRMHGCGHDAHTAILLMAAEILNKHKSELCGNVRLIFQSGEESGSGALKMLEQGAIDGVDAICALHVGNLAGNDHEAGDVIVLPGPVSAGKDKFTITVKGKGTHSAFVHHGVDPILIAARIVNATEEIAARELPAGTAAVLSFGSLHAGIDHNTIPDTAVIKGSIRVQDVEIRNFIGNRMKAIAENIAAAFRAQCEVEIKRGSSTVMNDENLSEIVRKAAEDVIPRNKVVTKTSAALMGSDDFANYANKIPAVYYFLHTNNVQKGITEANHNPKFDIDEEVLWEGVAVTVSIAKRFLSK